MCRDDTQKWRGYPRQRTAGARRCRIMSIRLRLGETVGETYTSAAPVGAGTLLSFFAVTTAPAFFCEEVKSHLGAIPLAPVTKKCFPRRGAFAGTPFNAASWTPSNKGVPARHEMSKMSATAPVELQGNQKTDRTGERRPHTYKYRQHHMCSSGYQHRRQQRMGHRSVQPVQRGWGL